MGKDKFLSLYEYLMNVPLKGFETLHFERTKDAEILSLVLPALTLKLKTLSVEDQYIILDNMLDHLSEMVPDVFTPFKFTINVMIISGTDHVFRVSFDGKPIENHNNLIFYILAFYSFSNMIFKKVDDMKDYDEGDAVKLMGYIYSITKRAYSALLNTCNK